MKLHFHSYSRSTQGFVLLIVMALLAVSLIAVLSVSRYTSQNVKLNQRNNDYFLAVGAAEAASEKVLSQMTSDCRDYGLGYVVTRLDTYRGMTPTSSEATEWSNFRFKDLSRVADRVDVQYSSIPGYFPVGGQYGTLRAFKDRARILANAEPLNSRDHVVGSVYQDIEFTRIPIFQFAVFYNVIMEFTPQPPMTITGPVHCNTNIYMNPAGALTFKGDVTSSGNIINGPIPWGPFSSLGGTTTYAPGVKHDSGVSTLNLPIGTNNSPAAVHQVLEMPLVGENPQSSLGRERYYNKADLIVLVSNTTTVVKSGLWNNFATTLSTNELSTFVSTTNSFYNKREAKTVKSVQLDVAKLVQWNATNTSIRPNLPWRDVRTVYVADFRTMTASNESGVKLINGVTLPPQGLTVATPSPLYTLGDYNSPVATRGTTNTTGTMPASFVADAITFLSTAWRDTNSSKTLDQRVAGNTTVNAAFLTGIVATTSASDSGGVENFPRFLEEWTSKTLTYNGSMVAMFYSSVATGTWKGIGSTYDIYNPPNRNWALDMNYQMPDKLPPATPSLLVIVRANWRIAAAYSTNVMAGF